MAPVVAAGPSGGTLAEVAAAEGGQEMRRPCKRQRCEEEGEEEGEGGGEGKGEALRAARLTSVVVEGTRLYPNFLSSRLAACPGSSTSLKSEAILMDKTPRSD